MVALQKELGQCAMFILSLEKDKVKFKRIGKLPTSLSFSNCFDIDFDHRCIDELTKLCGKSIANRLFSLAKAL